MSKFDFLQQQLSDYQNLQYHQDQQLADKLQQVQVWQKDRMQRTHADFFAKEEHQPMAHYFLNRLYGADDFDELARQIDRFIRNAHKVEKFIPKSALHTGDAGVELAVLAIQLDEQVAKYLLENYPANTPLDDEMMRLAYLAVDQAEPRLHQMQLLETLGEKLDKYVRSTMVKTAFKLSKGVAYRHEANTIYDFIDDGFKAMAPLDSAQDFIATFTTKEKQIIDAVHTGHPKPFTL